MSVTRTFKTKSSTKYIQKRTVCLPAELVNAVADSDYINITINSPKSGTIEFSVAGLQIRTEAQRKTAKSGATFYTYKY